MKTLAGLLIFAGLASAADKRYVVCLDGGGTKQCTKPLTKEAADAVWMVFTLAPIGGIDAVTLEDTKAKQPKQPKAQPKPAPEPHQQEYEPDVKL